MRERFEAVLLLRRRQLADELSAARAFRNQFKFYDGRQANASLSCVHLAKPDASYHCRHIWRRRASVLPGAPAANAGNLRHPEDTFMHSSLSDPDRRFADEAGSAVRVWNADGIECLCDRMLEKIRACHFPGHAMARGRRLS